MLPTAALPLCWEATIKLRPVVRPSGVPFLARAEFLTPLVWMVDDFVDQRFELEFYVKNTNSPKLDAVRSDQLNEKWEGQAGNDANVGNWRKPSGESRLIPSVTWISGPPVK